ncbi:YceI family protein [Actinoallomurus bryophytorum]|uniref:Polyisoprenoid-binding protein YceI n=2 Tax=Actinoallomurus bryophytorum TaxID=1490222 RepID=A0A543CJI7_9ACTN|nr:polyisoprenoid-binding protein YceI [Actinoallomurus bryophytorum]
MDMTPQVEIPGYVADTWLIDTAHSTVSFQARMLGAFKNHGTFDDFEGTVVTAADPLDSSANVTIRTASVNTKNDRRDNDLRKAYLNVEKYPTITFASTGVRTDGDHFLVDGDLTILETTKRVTLNLRPTSFDADGKSPARFTAQTEISLGEFGVPRGPASVIGDKILITLEIQASRKN